MSVSISRDLRRAFEGARDQGTRPTCLAFAVSDAHAALSPPFSPLSVEFLYYHAVQRMPDQDPQRGISPDAAAEALLNEGQPHESEWPYQLNPPLTLSAMKRPRHCQVFRRALPLKERSFDQIREVLDSGRPVILCLHISESFYSPNIDGIIKAKTTDAPTGSHAVIAVGHGTTSCENCILLRNSWGPTWGIGGHAFVEKSYMENRLILTSVIV